MIRRITGMTTGKFLRTELAGPLNVEYYIGTPAERDWARVFVDSGVTRSNPRATNSSSARFSIHPQDRRTVSRSDGAAPTSGLSMGTATRTPSPPSSRCLRAAASRASRSCRNEEGYRFGRNKEGTGFRSGPRSRDPVALGNGILPGHTGDVMTSIEQTVPRRLAWSGCADTRPIDASLLRSISQEFARKVGAGRKPPAADHWGYPSLWWFCNR